MTTHCKIASRRWMFNSEMLPKSTIATQPERVRQMFGSIARRYDLANHMLSCGADFYWRNHAAQIVAGWKAKQIVDLAAGTGDLSLAIQTKLPDAEITAVDFLPQMLEPAKGKGGRQTVLSDALRFPFVDFCFDCVTVSFWLRNMG